MSFSPIFYIGVFVVAWLVFMALYCLTFRSWRYRIILSAIFAFITLSHQILLDIGANYNVSIFPLLFFITTFSTNVVVFSLPLAIIITVFILGRHLIKQLGWLNMGKQAQPRTKQTAPSATGATAAQKQATSDKDKVAAGTVGAAGTASATSNMGTASATGTEGSANTMLYTNSSSSSKAADANYDQRATATYSQSATPSERAEHSEAHVIGDQYSVNKVSFSDHSYHLPFLQSSGDTLRDKSWLLRFLERYMPLHHRKTETIELAPISADQLQALNHKKGLPIWADGDDYTIVRKVRLEDLRKRSGAISWSSGDGDQVVFIDSAGNRTIVDTSVYDRIEYRDKFRHPSHPQIIAADGLLGWDDEVLETNEELSEEDLDAFMEREANRIYAATHQGRSAQDDIDAAALAALTPSGAGYSQDVAQLNIATMRSQNRILRKQAQKNGSKAPARKFHLLGMLRSCCALIFMGIIAISGYSTFLALSMPTVKTEVVSLDVAPQFDGISIVHLSDLYIGSYYTQQNLTNIVRKATQLRPDIIVITGEVSTSPPNLALQRLYPLFRLSAPLGVYVVVGEDISNYILNKFLSIYKSNNFMFLTNDIIDVPIGKNTMHILGIANHSSKDESLFSPENIEILSSISNPDFKSSDFSILLANSATYAKEYDKLSEQNINLILTGNTLGNAAHVFGDILGINENTYYPKLYKISDSMNMYVSSGTNIWPRLPIRLLTSGEITQIVIHSTKLNHDANHTGLIFQ